MSHADGQQTLGLFLRRRVTVLLAVLGMTATVLTGGAGSARGSIGTGRVPALHWSACGGGFECASLAVPLDYDHPRGDTTSLALIRLPAADQRHRIGSLLINPGGPGTSGVERVRQGARQRLPQVVRDRFDVVGFDPRGVASSSPIRCFSSVAAQSRFFAGVPLFPLFPVGHREQVAFIAKMAELGGICLRNNAAIMQRMSTANVARDMDVRCPMPRGKMPCSGYGPLPPRAR
jgi:pimeloyl-ACP methyl ester carboxylesterase